MVARSDVCVDIVGGKTVVDACDVHILQEHRFFVCPWGYAAKNVSAACNGEAMLQRIILQAASGFQVDHINGDKLDNRRANLRLATRQQNQWNMRRIRGRVEYKGVRRRGAGRYDARIRIGENRVYLGSYATAELAARAYDAAAVRIAGEFAATNASLGLLAAVDEPRSIKRFLFADRMNPTERELVTFRKLIAMELQKQPLQTLLQLQTATA